MRRVLIIVDDLNTKWHNRRSRDTGEGEYRLLALGNGPEVYQRAHGPLLQRYGIELLPVSEIAGQARDRVHRDYPQLMFDLARMPLSGGKSLLDLLAIEDANMWWLTDSSEKSPFRCSLVNQVYLLELVSAAVARWQHDEVWVSVGCPALNQALASFQPTDGRRIEVAVCGHKCGGLPVLKTLGFVLELLARRAAMFQRVLMQYWVLRRMNPRVPAESTKVLLLAPYPLVWADALGEHPSDRMYGALRSVLDGWRPTGYLATIHFPWTRLWRHRKRVKRNLEKMKVVPLLTFGSIGDVFSILWPPYLAKVIRAMHSVHCLPSHRRGEFDLAPLIVSELRCSLRGNELLLDIVLIRCLKRLCRQRDIDFIIHWGEFQPIEKAIWYGTRDSGIKTVAFQHSTSSPMFLSYHFAKGEIDCYLREPHAKGSMPLPTFFATTGHYAARALQQAGFPAERIVVCGAIRYRHLLELRLLDRGRQALRAELDIGPSSKVVLLTPATRRSDNLHIARSAAAALSGQTGDVTLLIKCHPLLPMEAEMESIVRSINPTVRCVTFRADSPLHRLVAVADVMVTNSSASGVEAIALGVVPVFFHNPYLYDVSVLYSLEDAILLASDTGELASALKSVFENGREVSDRKARWDEVLKEVFYALDTGAEERLVGFLKERDGLVASRS